MQACRPYSGPCSPEMVAVARLNRTIREELFEVVDLALITADFNQQIEGREYTYNYVLPHQELDYLMPYEYYRRWKKNQKTQVSLIS